MMPLKKKPAVQTLTMEGSCCVCSQAVSSKDEALFCDGCCQQLLHCYCTSIIVQHYKAISEKAVPSSVPAVVVNGSSWR